jgi:hypothetical protein
MNKCGFKNRLFYTKPLNRVPLVKRREILTLIHYDRLRYRNSFTGDVHPHSAPPGMKKSASFPAGE